MAAGQVRNFAEASFDANGARFERCFREHYTTVMAFALRRTVGRDEAEDVVAETFAIAWRRRELIPEESLPWLYGISLRVLANQRRSARRRNRLSDQLGHEADIWEVERDPAETLDRRSAFSSAFRRLREGEREVLRLVAWDGLDTREAASVLGCSEATFRVRLYRARRRLGKHLAAAGHSADVGPREAPGPTEETK